MAAAPSPIVTASSISATSSGVPIGTLMLDSPHTQVAALPVVCPSPIGWECTRVQGASGLTLFHSDTDIICLFGLQHLDYCRVVCPSKVWPLGGHNPTRPVSQGSGSHLTPVLENPYIRLVTSFSFIMYSTIPSIG